MDIQKLFPRNPLYLDNEPTKLGSILEELPVLLVWIFLVFYSIVSWIVWLIAILIDTISFDYYKHGLARTLVVLVIWIIATPFFVIGTVIAVLYLSLTTKYKNRHTLW
jgi:hypothetical protein